MRGCGATRAMSSSRLLVEEIILDVGVRLLVGCKVAAGTVYPREMN